MTDLGQIFTKGIVARYMVSLFDLPKQANIMDPCFGTGSFLDALMEYEYINVTACEIDTTLFTTAKSMYPQYQLINDDFLKHNKVNTYDGIVMNPPYIRQEKINELESYGITKGALRLNPIFSGLPSTANMYMYFIVKAIDLLKDGGQLIVIFPSSWMNAKSGANFQEKLLSKCSIDKQVYIHGEVFEREALVDVVFLKLIKGKCNINTHEEHLEARNGKLEPLELETINTLKIFSYPFSELATIKRGLTTGCNRMYINPDMLSVNSECFKPIISSPKSIKGYTTLHARLDRLFVPNKDTISEEVLGYLDFWKNKIINEHKPKTVYSKINSNATWYELREICAEGILFSYFVRNDMKFVMNETGVLVRDNFYIISPHIDKWLMLAFLNNYYTYYQLELSGKKYGAGLLKLQRYDIEALTFPDYTKISNFDKEKMMHLSHKLVESADKSIIDEITRLMSKYCSINYEDIMERYALVKSNRLEVV